MMHTTKHTKLRAIESSDAEKLLGQEVDELRVALQGERAALSVLRSQQLNEADLARCKKRTLLVFSWQKPQLT